MNRPGLAAPSSREDLARWLRWLRLAAIVLPILFLAVFPLLWPSNWHLAAGIVGALCAVLFGRAVFATLERGYRELVALQDRAVQAERHSAVVQERERIAREMHDSLAQVLSVAHLRLRVLEQDPALAGAPGARTEAAELAQMCQDACRDVRESILGLRESTHPERGFTDQVAHFLRSWSRTSAIPASLRVEAPEGGLALAPGDEVQLSRVVQEALTNVRKHSGASRVAVLLAGDARATRVEVCDDGVGFEPGAARPDEGEGYGLHTMRERVEGLGGRLRVESRPGLGTRVTALLPAPGGTLPEPRDEDRPAGEPVR